MVDEDLFAFGSPSSLFDHGEEEDLDFLEEQVTIPFKSSRKKSLSTAGSTPHTPTTTPTTSSDQKSKKMRSSDKLKANKTTPNDARRGHKGSKQIVCSDGTPSRAQSGLVKSRPSSIAKLSLSAGFRPSGEMNDDDLADSEESLTSKVCLIHQVRACVI